VFAFAADAQAVFAVPPSQSTAPSLVPDNAAALAAAAAAAQARAAQEREAAAAEARAAREREVQAAAAAERQREAARLEERRRAEQRAMEERQQRERAALRFRLRACFLRWAAFGKQRIARKRAVWHAVSACGEPLATGLRSDGVAKGGAVLASLGSFRLPSRKRTRMTPNASAGDDIAAAAAAAAVASGIASVASPAQLQLQLQHAVFRSPDPAGAAAVFTPGSSVLTHTPASGPLRTPLSAFDLPMPLHLPAYTPLRGYQVPLPALLTPALDGAALAAGGAGEDDGDDDFSDDDGIAVDDTGDIADDTAAYGSAVREQLFGVPQLVVSDSVSQLLADEAQRSRQFSELLQQLESDTQALDLGVDGGL
jgi:hypothetical protein